MSELRELLPWFLFALLLRYGAHQRNLGRFSGSKRKLTRRSLPTFFLVFAIMLGLMALVGPLIGGLSIAKESDLKFVAGSVQRAPRWTTEGDLIRIRVETDDGICDLFEEDLSHSRAIMKLKPGDQVTARVQSLLGEYHIWELKRDGVTIESYQDMYLYETRRIERGTTNALWTGLVASILLTVALALRMYFGAWRAPTPSGLGIQNGSEEADAGQPWQGDSTPSGPAIQNRSQQADPGQPWQRSMKKKCPKCGSSCYIFDRQCPLCEARLPSPPLYYWVVAEGLFLSALVIAFVKAGVWGGVVVIALGFIVEGMLRNFARRGTDTAGV